MPGPAWPLSTTSPLRIWSAAIRSGWVCGLAAYRLCHAAVAASSSQLTEARASIAAPSWVLPLPSSRLAARW